MPVAYSRLTASWKVGGIETPGQGDRTVAAGGILAMGSHI